MNEPTNERKKNKAELMSGERSSCAYKKKAKSVVYVHIAVLHRQSGKKHAGKT